MDVSGVGDINNDGYSDFYISAPNQNSQKGEIYLIFGDAEYISTGNQTTFSNISSGKASPGFLVLSLSIFIARIFIRLKNKKG